MKRVQDRLGVGFGDAEEGAGGAFGAAVAVWNEKSLPGSLAERFELRIAQDFEKGDQPDVR